MQVDDDLNASFVGPVDAFLKVFCCTLGVWRIGVVESPVPDGNSDEVETVVSDPLKVF